MQTTLHFIVDFLKNNPIHCTSYLAKRSIHWIELLFWIITLITVMAFGWFTALGLIDDYKFRNNAITANLDFMRQEYLFPSVTLCPHDILNKTKLNEFSRKFAGNFSTKPQNLSDFLWFLSKTSAKTSYRVEKFKNTIPAKDYMQLIFNLSNHFSVFFYNKKAVKIMTEVGICYTVNNFLSELMYTGNWSDLNPYPENFNDRFKRENLTYSFGSSFPIEEVVEHNITGNITVYVHSPFDIPISWSRPGLIVNDNNDIKSFILMAYIQEIKYDEFFLSQTALEDRRCLAINESNLKLFPTMYSRNICLLECRAYYIQRLCNCVPHFFSNKYWKNHKVCNERGLSCFNKYINILREINAGSMKCGHCKANCFEQITKIKTLKLTERHSNDSMQRLYYITDYRSIHSHSFIRSAMYTHFDIIVGLSGILSTFLGFSVYSLCDLIYYFTIRIYWFRRGYRGSVDELVF